MSTAASSRWLWGPGWDLLLGCGLGYAALAAVVSFGGADLRAALPRAIPAGPTLLLSAPHYGATLLRVYERRADRRGYVLFSVWATLLVGLAFVAGTVHALTASALVTLYLTWSPWHYTGQNFGIAVLFLRRRGVPISPGARRLLHASFVLSFVLVFLVMHGRGGEASDVPVPHEGTAVRFLPLGLPSALVDAAVPAVLLANALCLASAGVLLRRGARLRDLVPTATLALTQILWFSLPFAARHWHVALGLEPFDWRLRTHSFVWIAMGHAVQYLWIASHYARSSSGWNGLVPYYGKVLATGAAIWSLPLLLLAPGRLGGLEYAGGMALLLSAGVNVHHFILDGVIWKLRHSRIAGVLIRDVPARAAAAAGGPVRRVVWATCALGLAASVGAFVDSHVLLPAASARSDWSAAARSLDRLAWVGRDDGRQRLQVARGLVHQRRFEDARVQYARSVELQPRLQTYEDLLRLQRHAGDWDGVVSTAEALLRLEPRRADVLLHAGVAELRRARPAQARAYLERSLTLEPDQPQVRALLGQASAAPARVAAP